MSTCPPAAPPANYDVRNTANCVVMCQTLLAAYYQVISGNQTTVVRYNERWVEYNKANADSLRDNYMLLYNQCPSAKAAGLPDINPANKVRRGAPARAGFPFPRMEGGPWRRL